MKFFWLWLAGVFVVQFIAEFTNHEIEQAWFIMLWPLTMPMAGVAVVAYRLGRRARWLVADLRERYRVWRIRT